MNARRFLGRVGGSVLIIVGRIARTSTFITSDQPLLGLAVRSAAKESNIDLSQLHSLILKHLGQLRQLLGERQQDRDGCVRT